MAYMAVLAWIALLQLTVVACSKPGQSELVIAMPGVTPHKDEAYFCTRMKLPIERGFFVGYEALATQSIAHHVLLYGCHSSASKHTTWECADTAICDGKEHILYAWAKDAPPLKLPGGVGFYVGTHTSVRYLVMQVHYATRLQAGVKDHTGIKIHILHKRLQFAAGMFDFSSDFNSIPPGAIGHHADVVCKYNNQETIVPFAYRVHTHSLGRTVSSYRLRDGKWRLIGQGNPQAPQAFYPIAPLDRTRIRRGDLLAARCTYDAPNRTTTTKMGSTSRDEMCNFYIMYYTDFYSSLSRKNAQTGCYESLNINLKFPAGSDKQLPLDWYKQKDEVLTVDGLADYEAKATREADNDEPAVMKTADDANLRQSGNTTQPAPDFTSVILVCVAVFVPAGFILSILIYQGFTSRRRSTVLIAEDIGSPSTKNSLKLHSINGENRGLLSSGDDSDCEIDDSTSHLSL